MTARRGCRPRFVVRKQRSEHVRPGNVPRWIAACQADSCGAAYVSPSWYSVMRWTIDHRCVPAWRFGEVRNTIWFSR